MSKWKVLTSSLIAPTKRLDGSSIHRFNGFELVASKNYIWPGYYFVHKLESLDEVSINRLINKLLCDFNTCDVEYLRYEVIIKTNSDDIDFINLLDKCLNQYGKIDYSTINNVTKGLNAQSSNDFYAEQSWILEFRHTNHHLLFKKCSYQQYSIANVPSTPLFTSTPSSTIDLNHTSNKDMLKVYTRENNTVSSTTILSHKLYGIDNTGNTRVWTSESIMLYILLHNTKLYQYFGNKDKHILELGGGMTALCGLGLACQQTFQPLCHSITLTDGHPDCLRNQKFCIEMNKFHGTISADMNIRVLPLRWTEQDSKNDIQILQIPINNYDTICNIECTIFDTHMKNVTVCTNSTTTNSNTDTTTLESIEAITRSKSITNEGNSSNSTCNIYSDEHGSGLINTSTVTTTSNDIPLAPYPVNNTTSNDIPLAPYPVNNTTSSDIPLVSYPVNTTTSNDVPLTSHSANAITRSDSTSNNRHNNSMKQYYDILIGCDILFFKEFHNTLISTLISLCHIPIRYHGLYPHINNKNDNYNNESHNISSTQSSTTNDTCDNKESSQCTCTCTCGQQNCTSPNGSVIFLLQPARGGTMKLFIERASPHFHIEVVEDYDDRISALRKEYLKNNYKNEANVWYYEEDIHYPILLILIPKTLCATSLY